LAFGAFSGTKITAGISTLAAKQAMDDPALPVEAPVIIFAPSSLALTRATLLALSLRDALGFLLSSLI